MSRRTLDGKQIRIKGSDVTLKVRFCTMDENLGPCVVTSFSGKVNEQFVTEDNPYGDLFPLDQIEVVGHEQDTFRVKG